LYFITIYRLKLGTTRYFLHINMELQQENVNEMLISVASILYLISQ